MRWSLLVLPLLLGSVEPALASLRAPGPELGAPLPHAGPAVDWECILASLRLEFFDAEQSRTYTAVGPFEVLRETADGVVVRGVAVDGNAPAQLTLRQIDSQLWAFARFDSREFVVQIR